MFQVRIHGRGGQGVVTTAELLALGCFLDGKHAQAFPSFGSERTGAPVAAFVRIDERPVRSHDPVTAPDAVLVQDRTLLGQPEVLEGLSPDGWLLVNTPRPLPPETIAALPPGAHLSTVDASTRAVSLVGRDAPGPALLGALAALTGVVGLDALLVATRGRFTGSVGAANADAVLAAYDAVTRSDPAGGPRAATG